MTLGTLFIGFLIAAAVLLFELGLLRAVAGNEARQKKKLKYRLTQLRAAIRAEPESLRRDSERSGGVVQWLASLPLFANLPRLVAQSGQPKTVVEVLRTSAVLALVAVVVAGILTQHLMLALGCAGLAAYAPILILIIKRNRRLAVFDAQLAEAIDIMVRALRAGYTFDSALQVIGEELPAPIAEEFALTHAELSFGVPYKIALGHLLDRMPSKPLAAFITAVQIQRETGGNLAVILAKISAVIRASTRFQRKVRTLTAEGRTSAKVLAAIPFVLGAFLFLLSPETTGLLFTDPVGKNLLVFSAISYAVGIMWMRSLLKVKTA